MSIRKVSDLETVSLIDGTQDLSDVNDSLLELSFPYHGDGGHSYKSVKAKYEDVRTDLLSSVFSSDTSVMFTTEVTFTSSVNMLCGLNVSGDLCVNIDNPDWQDTHVYVRAGDITLYGYNSVDIKSTQRINLSARNIYAYADTTYINGFTDSSQQIAEFSKSNSRLYAPLTSNSPIRIPTTVSSDTYSAVNVDYLNSEISAIKEWIQTRDEPDLDDFELIGTKLYTNEDLVNVEYLLQKKYKYTYSVEDADGNVTTKTELFVEYDLKSRPTIKEDTSNKDIYFPDILDNDTLAITTSETTNMTKPTTSNVQATTISLISMGTTDPLSGYITGLTLKSVATTESLNAHIFARITDFAPDAGRMLLPAGSTGKFNFQGRAGLNQPRYTFSTPQFLTGGHMKFMTIVEGRLGLEGVKNYTNIYMYAVFTPRESADDVCLYSGMPRSAVAYPDHERMYPQWKATGDIIPLEGIDVVVSKKTVRKYISDANNGYYVRSGKANKDKNETTFAYPERYAYMYTCSKSNQSPDGSYNTTLADEANGILTSKVNKSLSRNSQYFKSLGNERVYANGGAFQFIKTFNISRTYASKAKSMRIVFAVNNSKTGEFMIVNNALNVQVMQLD